jgi:phosphate transport system substrate-binding protein
MSTVSSADPMPIPDLPRRARLRAKALKQLACMGAAITILMLTAPAAGAEPLLQSTGSSFAGVAIQQWVGQSATLYGLNINWQVSSSVVGLNNFGQNQIDFAASDIPYSAQQSTYYPSQPYQYMPDVAGGLSFMFNLNGTDGQQITNLNLNTSLIGQIFLGKITNWNNSAIAAANPQLAGDLPNQKIIPVYRSDASGENYLLSDYLLQMDGSEFQAAQTAFNSGNPGQPTATWPVPAQGSNPSPTVYPGWGQGNLVGQSGSDNAANYVAAVSSLGSITYVETAYAKEHAFPVASLINASGTPTQPTSLNVSTALEKAILHADLTQNLSNVYTDPVANAYPLSAYSYLVTPCSPQLATAQGTSCASFTAAGVPQPSTTSPLDPQKGQEIGQFVDFLACAGQEKMAQLGYSPLPPNLVQEDFDAIGRLNGAKEPPPVSPADCANPYVIGKPPPPPPAQIQGQTGPTPGGPATGGGTGPGAGSTAGGPATGGASGSTAGGASGSTAAGASGAIAAKGGLTAAEKAAGYAIVNGKLVPATAAVTGPSKYPRIDALSSAAQSLASPNLLAYFGGALLLVAIVFGPPLVGMRRRRKPGSAGSVPDTGSVA